MDIIGVMPLPPAMSTRWRAASEVAGGGVKAPEGPSSWRRSPSRARSFKWFDTTPPGTRFTVTATWSASRASLDAEYARRRISPPTGTRSVKNWPGAKRNGAPGRILEDERDRVRRLALDASYAYRAWREECGRSRGSGRVVRPMARVAAPPSRERRCALPSDTPRDHRRVATCLLQERDQRTGKTPTKRQPTAWSIRVK